MAQRAYAVSFNSVEGYKYALESAEPTVPNEFTYQTLYQADGVGNAFVANQEYRAYSLNILTNDIELFRFLIDSIGQIKAIDGIPDAFLDKVKAISVVNLSDDVSPGQALVIGPYDSALGGYTLINQNGLDFITNLLENPLIVKAICAALESIKCGGSNSGSSTDPLTNLIAESLTLTKLKHAEHPAAIYPVLEPTATGGYVMRFIEAGEVKCNCTDTQTPTTSIPGDLRKPDQILCREVSQNTDFPYDFPIFLDEDGGVPATEDDFLTQFRARFTK